MNATEQRPTRMNLSLLVQALRQQRWIILSFLGAVLLSALVGSLATTPEYRAVAVIELMPNAGKELDVRSVVDYDDAGYMERRDRARTQIQILLSRNIREQVLSHYNELGYDDIPANAEGADILKEALSAGPKEDTQLVEIQVMHPDPERAAVLANLVATVYEDNNLKRRTGSARQTQVWLEDQAEGYQDDLDAANRAVLEFKQTHGLVDIEQGGDDVVERLASLQKVLGEVTTERVLLNSKVYEYEQLLAAGSYTVLAGMLDDASVDAMSEQRAAAVAESASTAGLAQQHPDAQAAAETVSRIEWVIAQEVTSRVESDRARTRVLANQEYNLNVELEAVKSELLEQQQLQEEYGRLKHEADRLSELYLSLGDREGEVELQSLTRLNNVRMIDPALPPTRPKTPNIPLNMVMALVVGLTGGLGLALLRHRLSDIPLTAEEIENNLETPLLGLLPTISGVGLARERSLHPFRHPRSPSTEAFRSLRESLQVQIGTGRAYRLLVTSSLRGEGRSTTAVGLAIAFSQAGVRTLLLDADLRHPNLHTAFGVKRATGFTEAVETLDRFPLVTPTEVPHLDLLTAGRPTESPAKLLTSPELEKLVRQLSKRYPLVIIDSSPTAPVSDALLLSKAIHGVLVVARSGSVSRRRLSKTLKQLSRASAKVMGIALNDVPPSRSVGHYLSDGADGESSHERAAAP